MRRAAGKTMHENISELAYSIALFSKKMAAVTEL